MAEDSLETRIQEFEDIQIPDRINRRIPYSLNIDGITISYDRSTFREDPEGYIDQQLIALQTHLEAIREIHSDDQRLYERDNKVYGMLESTQDPIEEINQGSPPDQSIPLIKKMSKFRYAISSLAYRLGRTNPESIHEERVESSQRRERLYNLLMNINEAGNGFFEWLPKTREARRLPADYHEKLQECVRISGEISIVYSNIIAIAQRRAQLHQKFYQTLTTKI